MILSITDVQFFSCRLQFWTDKLKGQYKVTDYYTVWSCKVAAGKKKREAVKLTFPSHLRPIFAKFLGDRLTYPAARWIQQYTRKGCRYLNCASSPFLIIRRKSESLGASAVFSRAVANYVNGK